MKLRGLSRTFPHHHQTFRTISPSASLPWFQAPLGSTLITQNPQPTWKREINHLRRPRREEVGKAAPTGPSTNRLFPLREQPHPLLPAPLHYSTTPTLHFPC